MTTSKKPSQPKSDITAPAQPGDTPADSLPASANVEGQSPVEEPIELQDAATPPSATEIAPVEEDAIAEPTVAVEPIREPGLRITARHPNGFWRCGRQWHPAGEVLTLSEIGGEAVLAALRDEPMLIVALEP